MNIVIKDTKCPICGSEKVRSKVCDRRGWWYICDNWGDPHMIVTPQGKEIGLRDYAKKTGKRMFYFNPECRAIEIPGLGVYEY